ncbi:MAG: nuclear transport factor 2 family protein [Acidimicrobiia bacterium]
MSGAPQGAEVRALQDRLDVIEVCTRLHWLVDRKRWDELDQVLAPRVCLPTLEEQDRPDFDARRATRSLEEIVASYVLLLGGLRTQHLVTGHQVELDGDAAVCWAHSVNVHWTDEPGAGKVVHGNEYRFDLARTGAGWRIVGRRTRILWSEGDESLHDVTSKQRDWVASLATQSPEV